MSEETIVALALEQPDPAARAAFVAEACGEDAALRRRVEALLLAREQGGDSQERQAVELGAGHPGRPGATAAFTPAGQKEGGLPAHTLAEGTDEQREPTSRANLAVGEFTEAPLLLPSPPGGEGNKRGDRQDVTEDLTGLTSREMPASPAEDPGATIGLPRERDPELTASPVGGGGKRTDNKDELAFLAPSQEAGSLGRLDHFEVLEVVGRGGFGIVLKARDTRLQRIDAIKVLAPQLAASGTARRRFAREARAAAAVRDEHVVAIHGVHEKGPVPYLVMEFIAGITVDERLKQGGPLEVKEVLRIGMQAALALAAAHAQGLIHRDVKPGNILLESGLDRVKITDFGLARAADDASITQSGVIAGTPLYMSPEQARGEPVDHRSDLFSLGSVLYTLCTGHPAFRAPSTMAVLKRVCHEVPKPIRESNPEVPKWLCAVVGKLLAKKPEDRFQSAAEVADLLGQFLAHLQQPDTVAPPPPVAGVGAWTPGRRRKRTLVVAAAALVVVAVGGYLALRPGDSPTPPKGRGGQEQPRAWRPRTEEELAALPSPLDGRKREQIPAALLALAGGGDPAAAPAELVAVLGERHARFQLDRTARNLECSPDGRLLAVCCEGKVFIFEARTGRLKRAITGTGRGANSRAVFNSDGSLLLTPDEKETARLWEVGSGKLVQTYRGHSFYVLHPLFGPKGTVITSGVDGTVRVWDAASGKQKHLLPHGNHVHGLALSSDGKWLVTGCNDRSVRVWDLASGTLKHTLSGHTDVVGTVRFSPDGKLLTSGSNRELKLWNATTFAEIRTVPASAAWFRFTPDSSAVLCGTAVTGAGERQAVTRWEVKSGVKQAELPLLNQGRDHKFAMTPDGKTLFHALENESLYVRTYDAETGKELFPRQGHTGAVWSVAVSADGHTVVSGGTDGDVRLWDLGGWKAGDPQPPVRSLTGHTATVYSVAFSPDGKLIASASQDGTMRLWDVTTAETVRTLARESKGSVSEVAFSPDGKILATGEEDGSVRLWDVASGEEQSPLRWHDRRVSSVAFSPDGRFLASAGFHDRKVHLTDLRTSLSVQTFSAAGGGAEIKVAFGGDGRTLTYGGGDDRIRLWDLEGKKETVLTGGGPNLDGLAVGPTGRFVAATAGGVVRFWHRNAPSRSLVIGPGPFGSTARHVAFTPEGRYVVVAGFNGAVSILRTPTPPTPYHPGPARKLPNAADLAKRPSPIDGLKQAKLPPGLAALLGEARFRLPKVGQNSWMAMDREGKFLAVPNADVVAIFDARTGELVRTLTGHNGRVYAVAFSPDGKFLAGGSFKGDHTIKVWDLKTGDVTATLKGHTDVLWAVAFSPDGKRLVSAGADGAKVWDLETGKVLRTLEAVQAGITGCCKIGLSPDGKRIVCGDQPSKTFRVFEADTGKLLATLPGHTTDVRGAAYRPDGKLLATGSDKELLLWDADKLELVKKIDTPAGWLALAPDGRSLLTAQHNQNGADRSHVVTRWDLATFEGKPLPSLSKRAGWTVFHLSPDGKALYSLVVRGSNGQGERRVRVYDADTGKPIPVRGHAGQVWSVAASPDGKRLASAGEDGTVRLWDLSSGKQLHAVARSGPAYSAAFSPDGKTLAAHWNGGPVVLFDAASGAEVRKLDGNFSAHPSKHMPFSPDGTLLAAAGGDGQVRLWDVASGRLRRTFWTGPGMALAAAFSPDGKVIATGSQSGAVTLWDVASGWQVGTLPRQRGDIMGIGFHPDGRSVAVGGYWRGDRVGPDSPKYGFAPTTGPNKGKAGQFLSKTYTRQLEAGQQYRFEMTSLDEKLAPLLVVDEAGGKQIHSARASSPRPPLPAGRTALAFDGEKSWVKIPSLRINKDHAFTVETWAVLEDPVARRKNYDLICNSGGAGFALCVAPVLHGGDGRKLGFLVRLRNQERYERAWESQPVARNQPVHLAGVYDGKSEIRFFVNGHLQSRVSARSIKPSPRPVTLGGNSDGGSRFLGRMNEVRISRVARYDTDFTPARRWGSDADTIALYHFDEGEGAVLKDSSGNGHHGEIIGAKWVKVENARAASGSLPRAEITIRPTKATTCKVIACAESGHGWFELKVQRGESSTEWLGVGYVPVYDLATGKETHRVARHDSGVRACVWRADGQVLVTAGDDGTLRAWNMAVSPPAERPFRVMPYGSVHGFALTPEGRYVAVATPDGDIPILRIPNPPPPYDPGPARPVPDPKDLAARPAAADALKRANIPPGLLKLAGGGDPARVPPEVVAILGDDRFHLPRPGASSWLAQDREGKLLAVPNADVVALFDAKTGKLVRTLTAHTGRVYAVAFSPDGKFLAGGNWTGEKKNSTVKVWNLETGDVTVTLESGASELFGVTFSRDGKRLFASSAGGVQMWDLTGKLVRTFKTQAPAHGLYQIGLSADGKRVVCNDTPTTIKVWEIEGDKDPVTLTGHTSQPLNAVYSPDGKLLATGSDKELLLWDAEKLKLVKKIDTPAGWLAFDPDGKSILAAQHHWARPLEKDVVTRWDLTSYEGKPLRPLTRLNGWPVYHLSPDGKTLFSLVADGQDKERRIRSYDAATGKELFPARGHSGQVSAVAFSPDGKRLASVSSFDPGVRLWDAATGKPERVLPNEKGFWSVAFSPDGKRIAAGEARGTVVIYDALTGEKLRTLPAADSDVRKVCFSPDGTLVAGTTFAGVVNVWDVATGRLRQMHSGRPKDAWSVAFSPDGKTLATGWNENEVILFDVGTGWEVARIRVGVSQVRWLGFHPDGRSLAVVGVGDGQQNLGVWNLETRKEVRRMPVPGHLGGAWRADGLLMASCGAVDGTVRLWFADGKSERRRVIQLFPPDAPWLEALAMSPEGRHLATANPDGTVSILRIPGPPPAYHPGPARPVPSARKVASRPAAADALKRENIPAALLKLARGDPRQVPPEVVAILGDDRFLLPKAGASAWLAQDRKGKFLAVPNADCVALFDARTGELVRTLAGEGRMYAVAFSPDGKFLAAGNRGTTPITLKIWDLNSGEVTATLKSGVGEMWSLAYSPDGKHLIGAGDRGTQVWDLATGKVAHSFTGGQVYLLGLSPDGKKVAFSDPGAKTVRVFNPQSGKELGALKGAGGVVTVTAFSPDGKWLAAGNDQELLLWDAEKPELVKKIDTPAGWLAFEPGGKTLLTASNSQFGPGPKHVVTRWDLESFEGKSLPSLSNRQGWTHFYLSPDGKTLFSLVADGQDRERRIRAYDAATGKQLFSPRGHSSQVWSVAFSPDGKRLASVSSDPGIRLHDAATGKPERVLPNDQGFFSVAFSADGKSIAAGEINGTVVLYDATSGMKLRTLLAPKSQVRAVCFSPDGGLVAGTTALGIVHVWESATGRLRRVFRPTSTKSSWSVAFSADGKTLATGWEKGEVILFDVATGWEVADLRVGIGNVRWLGFHPDGRSLGAVVSYWGDSEASPEAPRESTFCGWDLMTRKEMRMAAPGLPRSRVGAAPVHEEHGHIGGAWRADGQMMAVCGANDGTLRLWRTDGKPERDRVIRLFPPKTEWLHGLALSPEGRHLATANPDGTVTILRLAKPGDGD